MLAGAYGPEGLRELDRYAADRGILDAPSPYLTTIGPRSHTGMYRNTQILNVPMDQLAFINTRDLVATPHC